jgi:hypothetical protein
MWKLSLRPRRRGCKLRHHSHTLLSNGEMSDLINLTTCNSTSLQNGLLGRALQILQPRLSNGIRIEVVWSRLSVIREAGPSNLRAGCYFEAYKLCQELPHSFLQVRYPPYLPACSSSSGLVTKLLPTLNSALTLARWLKPLVRR